MIQDNIPRINFIFQLYFCHFIFWNFKGVADVRGKNCIRTNNELPSKESFASMHPKISRQLQSETLYLHRTILLYGLRSINWSRKPSRYCILPSSNETSPVPYGPKEQDIQKYHRRCKRKSRLAYLCLTGDGGEIYI